MCETAIITGVISFVVGFALGRLLGFTKKEPEQPKKKEDEQSIIIRIHG